MLLRSLYTKKIYYQNKKKSGFGFLNLFVYLLSRFLFEGFVYLWLYEVMKDTTREIIRKAKMVGEAENLSAPIDETIFYSEINWIFYHSYVQTTFTLEIKFIIFYTF